MRPLPRRAAVVLAAAAGICALAGVGWWALVGSVQAKPVPPPAADEGQEGALYAEYLRALTARRPDNWQAQVNLASLLSGEGRSAEALDRLREAARVRPRDPFVHVALAATAEEAGRSDEALRAWGVVARLQPQSPMPRLRLAQLYRQLGWFGLADRASLSAVKLAPKDPEALRARAVVEFSLGYYDATIRTARRILEVEPNSAVAHSILAGTHKQISQWEPAFRHAESAIRCDPSVTDFHVDLARMYLDRPQPDEQQALAILQAAPASDTPSMLLRGYWRGLTLLRLEQTDAALRDLTAVYERAPEYEEVTYHLSKAWRQAGDTRRASQFTRAYQELQSRRIALKDAEASLRRNMNDPALHVRTAKAALAMGDTGRAAIQCRSALALRPGYAPAQELLKQVTARMERGS